MPVFNDVLDEEEIEDESETEQEREVTDGIKSNGTVQMLGRNGNGDNKDDDDDEDEETHEFVADFEESDDEENDPDIEVSYCCRCYCCDFSSSFRSNRCGESFVFIVFCCWFDD